MSCDVGEAELILQAFRHFTYVTIHSPTFPSLYLRHSSFSNPFRYFTNVTAHSPILLSLLLRHRIFTYVTWRAAHAKFTSRSQPCGFHGGRNKICVETSDTNNNEVLGRATGLNIYNSEQFYVNDCNESGRDQ